MVCSCCLEGPVGVVLGCGRRSRWEPWLPPLTSTGGQCNIKVPPDCSVPHTLTEALPSGIWVSQLYLEPLVGRCEARWAEGVYGRLRINFVCFDLKSFIRKLLRKPHPCTMGRINLFPPKGPYSCEVTLVRDPFRPLPAFTWEGGVP